MKAIWLEDMNNDNRLSIIGITRTLEGKGIVIFDKDENNYNTTYKNEIDSLHTIAVADWNMDGLRDILYQKAEQEKVKLYLLLNKGGYIFSDAIEILTYNKEHNFIIEDLNNDQQKDLIYSTKNEKINPQTEVLLYNKDYDISLDSTLTNGLTYSISLGEYNANSSYGLFLSHQVNDQVRNEIIYQTDSLVEHLIFEEITDKVLQSFMADFTSDGLTDIMLLVETSQNQKKVIMIKNMEERTYEIVQIVEKTDNTSMAFKDNDEDGDLDLFLWGGTDTNKWIYYENKAAANNYGPSPPIFHSYLMISQEPKLFWTEANDDHSMSTNITYDVAIGRIKNRSQIYAPILICRRTRPELKL
jgi:hypothetical protein